MIQVFQKQSHKPTKTTKTTKTTTTTTTMMVAVIQIRTVTMTNHLHHVHRLYLRHLLLLGSHANECCFTTHCFNVCTSESIEATHDVLERELGERHAFAVNGED